MNIESDIDCELQESTPYVPEQDWHSVTIAGVSVTSSDLKKAAQIAVILHTFVCDCGPDGTIAKETAINDINKLFSLFGGKIQ